MKKFLMSLVTSYLMAVSAGAEIVTATGNAPIINNNVSDARNKAVKDALNQALLQTGANISYEQEISNGALTKDNFKLKSSSNIKSYTILKQENHSDYLTVTIRADIVAKSGKCSTAHSKSLTPIKFFYDDNQLSQSQRGLYDINKEITRQIYGRLLQNDKIFDTRAWIDSNYKLDLRTVGSKEINRNIKQQLIQLARQLDTQFLLLGSIRDITFSDPDGNMLTKMFKDPKRNISFSIYIINGYTGDVIYSRNYQGIADWDLSESNDVKGQQFWKSSFGKTLNQMIGNATADITRELQCQKLYTRIIKIDGNQFFINAGETNKIRPGDRFKIELNSTFYDPDGKIRITGNEVNGEFIVKKVFSNSAILEISKGKPDTNIQLGDFAISLN